MAGLIEALSSIAHEEQQAEEPEPVERVQAAVDEFNSILDEYEERKQSHSQASSVPTFYRPKPKPDTLTGRIRREAKLRKEQETLILSEEDLRNVWYKMEEFAAYMEQDEVRINYDGFSQVSSHCREEFGPGVEEYFRASVFAMFERDGNGCISANHFLTYLSQRIQMQHNRLQLSTIDTGDSCVLSADQLEDYLRLLVGQMPALQELQPSFLQHYKKIAVRKILFFHGRNGSVRVRDLAVSSVMGELMELKTAPDPASGDTALMANWFSLQSTRRVYNTFLALDADMNGLLSCGEFSAISNNTMSHFFIQRIFEENAMRQRLYMSRSSYRDEMDLVAFTDFVLAWDHRSHPCAIKYFFDIFDAKKQGAITPVELYMFFKEIHHMWVHNLNEYAELNIYDVVDEILDMIKPKVQARITAEDLAASGQSGIFFSVLADVKQFWEYNYRENLINHDEDQ